MLVLSLVLPLALMLTWESMGRVEQETGFEVRTGREIGDGKSTWEIGYRIRK